MPFHATEALAVATKTKHFDTEKNERLVIGAPKATRLALLTMAPQVFSCSWAVSLDAVPGC